MNYNCTVHFLIIIIIIIITIIIINCHAKTCKITEVTRQVTINILRSLSVHLSSSHFQPDM